MMTFFDAGMERPTSRKELRLRGFVARGIAPFVVVGYLLMTGALAGQEPIEIAAIEREEAVDFDTEILPIFRANCLACHNETDAEGDLILETVEDVLAGSATGSIVEPGEGNESFLLQVSAHLEEPIMPPADNAVEARPLTPQELGLLKLWIDQGALPSAETHETVVFEPLPPGLNPVYAVAVSDDSQYVVAGRANQTYVYHLPTKREVGRLTDPTLMSSGIYQNAGVAHLDLVQSVAVSPNGMRIATGGFRTVKVWERTQASEVGAIDLSDTVTAFSVSPDHQTCTIGTDKGTIVLLDLNERSEIRRWQGHESAVASVVYADASRVISCSADQTVRQWTLADGTEVGQAINCGHSCLDVRSVMGGEQIAVACADHVIRVYPISSFEREPVPTENEAATEPSDDVEQTGDGEQGDDGEQGESQTDQEAAAVEATDEALTYPPVTPTLELKGHSNVITAITILGDNDQLLVSASQDQTIRIWQLPNGNVVRQMSHGGPVSSMLTTADGTRIISASTNQTLKVWDASNGRQLHEMRGDLPTQLADEEAQRDVTLRQRHVQLATTDLEQANQRKTAETENQTNMQAALETAQTEHEAKATAAQEAVTAKENAEKALEEARARLTAAEEAAPQMAEALTAATEQMTMAQSALDQIKTEADTVNARFVEQLGQLDAIREQLKANPQDKDQLTAFQTAIAQLAELTPQQRAMVERVEGAQTELEQATTAKATAEAQKQAADEELQQATAAIAPAETMVNNLTGPAQTATDELTTAERNLASAQRSMTRANEAVTRATDAIPTFETALTQAQETHAAAEQIKQQTAAAVQSAGAPQQAVWMDHQTGVLYSTDQTGRIQSWSHAEGVQIETLPVAAVGSAEGESVSNLVQGASLPGDQFVLINGSSIRFISTKNEWTLKGQIGVPDGESPFIDRITALDFSPDGSLLAVGGGEPSRSGEIHLVELESLEIQQSITDPHSDTVWSLRFSPDGSQLASAAADRFVKLFQVEDGAFVRSFEGHTHHVLGVGWSADGRQIASCGADKSVKIWDALTGDQKRTITGFRKEVTGICFVAQTDEVVVSCGDQTVQRKRASNGSNVRGFGGFSDFVHSIDAPANGLMIVAGGQDSVVRVWTAANGQVFAEFRPPE